MSGSVPCGGIVLAGGASRRMGRPKEDLPLAGATLLEAAVLANAAAGVVVGKVGTAVARPEEVRRLLPEAAEATGELP